MPENPTIFSLIKGLSGSEQRYFKHFANMGAGRKVENYLALFEALAGSDAYDREKLQKQFSGTPLARNLLSTQTRLQDLILKSLRTQYAGASVQSQLRILQEEIELLHDRRLLKACRKRLRKARDLARKYGLEPVFLQLLEWEQKLFLLEPTESYDDFYRRIEREEAACLARLTRLSNLLRSYEKVRGQYRRKVRAGEDQNWEILLKQPVLAEIPPAEEPLARIYFGHIHGLVAFSQGQSPRALSHYRNLMQVWDENPHLVAAYPDLYLGSVNNHLNVCAASALDLPGFLASVKKLQGMEGLPRATQLKFQRVGFFQQILYFLNFGGFEDAPDFSGQLQNWLEENRRKISPARVLVMCYNMTQLCFLNGQFRQANRWLMEILHFPKGEERRDIRDFARIFQLILQFELGNLDLQEYLARSAHRYFRRTTRLQDFEKALLGFLRRYPQELVAEEQRRLLQELDAQIAALIQRKDGPTPMGIRELQVWIGAKMRGVRIEEEYAQVRVRMHGE